MKIGGKNCELDGVTIGCLFYFIFLHYTNEWKFTCELHIFISMEMALFPYVGKNSHTWQLSKEQCFKLDRNKLAFHQNQNQAGKIYSGYSDI